MVGHIYSVQYDETVSAAQKIMSSHGIRHLPVLDGKKIMGILSERDIILGRAVYRDRAFEGNVFVKDICLFNECAVNADAHLDEVARFMSKARLDAVVVVENKEPVGIFTSTDACRLLADLCKGKGLQKGFFSRFFG